MTSTFNTTKPHLSPTHLALTSPPILPRKHWAQTCHETILVSNDNNYTIQLPLAGGSDNGQFVYFNDSISLLKNNTSTNIIKGGKIDFDEIILEIDQYHIAGYTLVDVQLLIETLSTNGKPIKLKTVQSGLTKDLRQFLDGRFEKNSIDHGLQQTIRDNLYMRTVPCTTRPPRPGEINGQDYTFLSVKDFHALEKSGKLLESGVYKGHYYGTPRPTKEALITNTNIVRRSNSANQMFQHNDPEFFNNQYLNENISKHLSGEFIKCLLKKSQHGFGFTIIDGHENGEQFLQIKDIIPDGPAAKDGKLQRGDILIYINDTNVLGYSHTDVVKLFQSLSIGDIIHLTVCRGYPLTVNINDPQIDIVSVNGIHQLPNGGYREYQPENHTNIYTIKIRKGNQGFGFTVVDSPLGQRVKSIFDKQRCQNLCENDLLLSINGHDLIGKQHADIVDILQKCVKDMETTFVVRRGDPDVNNNPLAINVNNYLDKNIQPNNRSIITEKHVSFLTNNKENKENDEIDIRYLPSKINEKPRSKTPTPYSTAPLSEIPPLRSRTPLPSKTTTLTTNNNINFSIPNTIERSAPIAQTEFSSDPIYSFNQPTTLSHNTRPTNVLLSRSKTPGPEFGATTSSSYRANTMKPRSKTPTAYEFSSNTLPNSRSLQSVHPQYTELVVNLTILRLTDGFGLRILGGEEEKSQVCIGHIVPNSPADIDGRLHIGDEIIKIDGHSTIRASHEKVVQLMQRAKENKHVCLIVRRHTNLNTRSNSYHQTNLDSYPVYPDNSHIKSPVVDNGVHYVTLQKTNENESFGFVIISSQNKAGTIVDVNRENLREQMENNNIYKTWIGKIIRNSPADHCGQLHINDRILAVNGVDLSHMVHTDVVNLIKESGRTITLTIGPPIHYDGQPFEIQHLSNNIPSSSPMVISNENNQTLRNAFSHNPLNVPERNKNRPSSKVNGILKSSTLSDDYFIVNLQRPSTNSSFGFSIRGGREFSVPLFILKLAENGLAERDGRMKSGDQIIEINGRSTYGMTHNEAISLIRDGGLYVRLLLRKTNAPPPSLDDVKVAMGNGMEFINTHWKPSGYT
ncbi:unnamed protein product [Rotaria sordida]|uniref:Uncharacterized protein n=1 Tax=Rotaria sordida TaxID=392033 RepID=A0A814LH06_9BILA|nr:unnamed protein product [Rotaria sordida]CAF1235288.1 unnamed protein product [Rotaria sordida]